MVSSCFTHIIAISLGESPSVGLPTKKPQYDILRWIRRRRNSVPGHGKQTDGSTDKNRSPGGSRSRKTIHPCYSQWIGLRENLKRKPWSLPSNLMGYQI